MQGDSDERQMTELTNPLTHYRNLSYVYMYREGLYLARFCASLYNTYTLNVARHIRVLRGLPWSA